MVVRHSGTSTLAAARSSAMVYGRAPKHVSDALDNVEETT
jgi:hypothetical protein